MKRKITLYKYDKTETVNAKILAVDINSVGADGGHDAMWLFSDCTSARVNTAPGKKMGGRRIYHQELLPWAKTEVAAFVAERASEPANRKPRRAPFACLSKTALTVHLLAIVAYKAEGDTYKIRGERMTDKDGVKRGEVIYLYDLCVWMHRRWLPWMPDNEWHRLCKDVAEKTIKA